MSAHLWRLLIVDDNEDNRLTLSERLALTHFGMVDDPEPHLEQMAQRLREQAALVRSLLAEHGNTAVAVRAFVREVDRRTREAAGVETAQVFEVGAPVEQLWHGLSRYWRKREAAVG